MTKQDLDRLITKTELNPVSKKALRNVREAMLTGKVGNPRVGEASWSISIQTDGDYPAVMTFAMKRI
jgi:hypothetical protein